MTIGEWLKAKREDAGITQEELAFRSNVSQRMVCGYETDQYVPSVSTFRKLAAGLGKIKAKTAWTPATTHPPVEADGISDYVLLSFSNCSTPLIGRYEIDSKAYYEGDDLTPLKKHGLIVNAWMPLPAPYKGTKIAISGELEQDTYEKPNGEKIERVGIKVNYHEFVEPKRAETPEDFADPFVEVPEEVPFV